MTFGLGELFALSCAFAWGVAVILLRLSGERLSPMPLNLFKCVLGVALFIPTLLAVEGWRWPGIPASAVGIALASGLLGIALGDALYFRALNAIGASRMAIAQTLYSPSVIVISMAFLGERLSVVQVGGVALVLAGIVLVNRADGQDHPRRTALRGGALLGGFAVFTMAAAVVMAKPLLEAHSFLWIVTLRMVGGLAGMLLFVSLSRQWRAYAGAYRRVTHWGAIVGGVVVGSYLSMMLWLAGYKYTQASIAAVLNELAAVFILWLAAVFLRERLRPAQWAGCVVALAGVLLVLRP